jgi:hypothetical protein
MSSPVPTVDDGSSPTNPRTDPNHTEKHAALAEDTIAPALDVEATAVAGGALSSSSLAPAGGRAGGGGAPPALNFTPAVGLGTVPQLVPTVITAEQPTNASIPLSAVSLFIMINLVFRAIVGECARWSSLCRWR